MAYRKATRNGKLYSGNHTAVTSDAHPICDILESIQGVNKIALGHISLGLGYGAERVVKLRPERSRLVIHVRGGSKLQEIFVYGQDLQSLTLTLARKLRDKRIRISFT